MLDKIPNWLLTVLVLFSAFLVFSGIDFVAVLLVGALIVSIGMAIFDKKEKG